MIESDRCPSDSSTFTHDSYIGAVMEDNYTTENGLGGVISQSVQNSLMRQNRCGPVILEGIPDSMVGTEDVAGVRNGYQVGDRQFGNNASPYKCIIASDSDKPTHLYNVDAHYNNLEGENMELPGAVVETIPGGFAAGAVQGCRHQDGDTAVYCRDNIPTTPSNYNDTLNATQLWNTTEDGSSHGPAPTGEVTE
jgi:hypothetical protein